MSSLETVDLGGVFISSKYFRRAHMDPHKFIFSVSVRNGDHE